MNAVMMTPAELKQYQADLQIVQSTYSPATSYLVAEEQFAQSAEMMRNRWRAALDCGAALKRIHDSESYRDQHGNWTEFMRANKLTRTHCYRLMKCAEILPRVPQSLIGRIDMQLSLNLIEELGGLDAGELDAVAEEACAIDDPDMAFSKLRETLRAMSSQGECKKIEPRMPRGIDWARKQTSSLERWFKTFGADERVTDLLRQLEQLAEELAARKAA